MVATVDSVAALGNYNGRRVHYLLHKQPVRFRKGKLRLRQITRLTQGRATNADRHEQNQTYDPCADVRCHPSIIST
jgi:hypothetical protein